MSLTARRRCYCDALNPLICFSNWISSTFKKEGHAVFISFPRGLLVQDVLLSVLISPGPTKRENRLLQACRKSPEMGNSCLPLLWVYGIVTVTKFHFLILTEASQQTTSPVSNSLRSSLLICQIIFVPEISMVQFLSSLYLPFDPYLYVCVFCLACSQCFVCWPDSSPHLCV